MRSVAVAFAVAAGIAMTPVTANVTVRGVPLVCGKPRGSFVVTFPATVDLPSTIAAGSVHVNGQAAATVAVHGHAVAVTAPLQTGITCQSITFGRVTLAFGTAAGISSSKAGTYAVIVRQGTHRYKAILTVGS
jgi:hypothetical protein